MITGPHIIGTSAKSREVLTVVDVLVGCAGVTGPYAALAAAAHPPACDADAKPAPPSSAGAAEPAHPTLTGVVGEAAAVSPAHVDDMRSRPSVSEESGTDGAPCVGR